MRGFAPVAVRRLANSLGGKMRIVTINISVCAAILVATFYVDSYLSLGWAQAFVLDPIFPVTFGWIYWSFLIEWLYVASYFLAVGILVAMLVQARNPGPWAAAVGVCFSLTYLILQTTPTSAHASGSPRTLLSMFGDTGSMPLGQSLLLLERAWLNESNASTSG